MLHAGPSQASQRPLQVARFEVAGGKTTTYLSGVRGGSLSPDTTILFKPNSSESLDKAILSPRRNHSSSDDAVPVMTSWQLLGTFLVNRSWRLST